jgi:conjugal transfer mating pair stabilization protein TraG
VQDNAATSAIHNFRREGRASVTRQHLFRPGQTGEKAFAAFTQKMVQWKAFGDHARLRHDDVRGRQRHFERNGYSTEGRRAESVDA